MFKKLILLVVLLMAIAVPFTSAAFGRSGLPFKTFPQLLIHWKFDYNLANSGTTENAYDLPLPTSPPPSYTTGLDSGALAFSKGDTKSFDAVMKTIGTLQLFNATVSFNMKQGTSWNNYLLLADSDAGKLSIYINGILIYFVNTTDPIGVLKNPTNSKIWLQMSSSLSDGAIDDFQVYNYIISTTTDPTINALSKPALFNRVNTDGSANVSIDEIVKYMNNYNTYDSTMAARLLDLIKPNVVTAVAF